MKYQDEIIEEVWKNREAYAARHHHNLQEIVADLQNRQKTPFLKLVDRRHPKKASRNTK
jgi:hypothetical protein